ncbi:hypothetical protein ACFFMO_00480 [Lederbergia wuyishanensis]
MLRIYQTCFKTGIEFGMEHLLEINEVTDHGVQGNKKVTDEILIDRL